MTETGGSADPRPQLSSALDQTQRQVDALRGDDFGHPTPCADYDAGTLVAHLIAVLRKLAAAGRGEDASAVTDPATDITGGWADEFRGARAGFEQVWSADAALGKSCTMPWAVMSGREVLDAYTHEFTVHSWDLAHVTGQVNDLDPVLGEAALDWFGDNVPADARSDDGQFGPVVDVDAGADVYARLAGYVGRPVQV
ncbi:TIGR03086 family metal-binding protein [Solicola gregarius]|uniref:TIGR03086 family metal-binding protein n=1 Tax=Solicola gregarius TaxID=2908642 RepID=A0AA46YMZ2_9ACTN|nr:TIGR03086 family metal-binding protein [Solicola gregarius]UYM07094.1 TIGR03086 family metal-binding protein [Solicola gregarius]